MKLFLCLLIAALLVGSACFAILYYVFHMHRTDSLMTSVVAATAGIMIEYLRPYFVTLEKEQKDRITNRVRRNLRHQEKQRSECSYFNSLIKEEHKKSH